jgi:RNA polymerase sigma factor (sigma-70 family)
MDYQPIARTGVWNRGRCTASADDVILLSRVADADGAAFEALHGAYHPRLQRFLGRFARQPALVEEIINDTMMIVWHKAHTYNSTSKVSTWIFAIAYRQALKALSHVNVNAKPEVATSAGALVREPEDELQQHQLCEQLEQALRSLPLKHRTVIKLNYYQGYACREIADLIACPLNTVKTRMLHARRKLKALLLNLDQAA